MKIILTLCISLLIVFPVLAKNEGKGKKLKTLPPGLEKKLERGKELPPGWQKKVEKGQILNSDLYDIAEKVSKDDKKYYPRSTPGTEILKIEERIFRIKKDTKEILEIIGIK